MKSLKCPLTKLSSYQHLMLGRGRRSQLVKTELQYDRQALVALARDTFVTDKHPLAKWFSNAAQEALEHSLLAKSEADAVNDLEEIASQRLLEHSVDQLRQSLMQRPVRGHCILVIDSVGPKAAAVAIVDPSGQVLAIDEIPVSASPSVVTQNVTRLGELVHQHRVTLVALSNGPARRFLVLSLRELINQKRHWISITPTKESSAERCRAIRAINVKLGELLAINRQQWIVEHQQLESQLEADQVLGSREYPWPWYPRETLEKFLLAFRSQRP